MSLNTFEVAPVTGTKTAGSLGAPKGVKSVGAAPAEKMDRKGPSVKEMKRSASDSMWKRPKRKEETYAEQYLNAYRSRWMMTRDPAVSAFRARQSVLSRLQNYSTLQRSDPDLEQR